MGPLLKTGRTTGAGYDPVPVAVPVGPRRIRTPANVPQAPRGSIALRMLAAASLLIHAAIIGALIVDFRSSQSKANKPPARAIQVEVVQEPRVPVLLHPIEPIASERPLRSPATSEAPLVVPQSAETLRGTDHAADPAVIVAAAKPRQTQDLSAAPLAADAAVQARTGDAYVVLDTAALDRVFARDLAAPSARVETLAPVALADRSATGVPLYPPAVRLPPDLAVSPPDDAVVMVAVAEPRETEDLFVAPLGPDAAVPTQTGDVALAIGASIAATPAADPAFAALPAKAPRTADAPARSVASDKASVVAVIRSAAVVRDEGMAPPGGWDGAELPPDSAVPAAAVFATETPAHFDRTGDVAAAAETAFPMAMAAIPARSAIETPASGGIRIDENGAPRKLALDAVASIVPRAAVTDNAAKAAGVVGNVRLVRPSMEAVAAVEVDESQAATPVAGGSVATGMLNAAWAPWGVQVAGNFSLDRAMASFTAIQQEFPVFAIGPPLVVRRVNRSRGLAPIYQILIPAADQKAATDICRRLESADGACVVFRN